MQLSKLEQAISDVLLSKQSPNFSNVFEAYKHHCDRTQLLQAQLYFQIAMDKYPDASEKKQSQYAAVITDIRREYLESSIDAAVSVFGAYAVLPCPCDCGSHLNMAQFREQLDIMFGPDADQFALPGPAPAKKTTKRRRIAKKVKGPRAQKISASKQSFDPFGPSTSRASM